MDNYRSNQRRILFGAAWVLLGLGNPKPGQADVAAAADDSYNVRSGDSKLTYHIVHKLHRVDGVSKKLEGKARLLPNGQAQVMIRVPSESFDSENSNRDAHMKETIEAARYSSIEFKAVCEGALPPASLPATITKTCKGQIGFHGVKKALEVPVRIEYQSADRIHAVSSLALSLEEFKIERPSLMFVKVDDTLKIDADVVFGK